MKLILVSLDTAFKLPFYDYPQIDYKSHNILLFKSIGETKYHLTYMNTFGKYFTFKHSCFIQVTRHS